MKIQVYNQKGEQAGDITVAKTVFDLPWNADLVHQVVVSMQSNQRDAIAHSKGRGDVRGGGKKPWRQKGTGRARHGSTRSPIWIGGGVTHGPSKDKNYSKKINKKMKAKAFLIALSQKFRDGEILFVDSVGIAQPKTKDAVAVLKNLSKISGFKNLATKRKNKAILGLVGKDVDVVKSFRNIPGMQISETRNLNVLDILTYKYLIIADPKESLKNWTK
jgi:large subunit ribosomal protein L4